jgi:hypothetical protein
VTATTESGFGFLIPLFGLLAPAAAAAAPIAAAVPAGGAIGSLATSGAASAFGQLGGSGGALFEVINWAGGAEGLPDYDPDQIAFMGAGPGAVGYQAISTNYLPPGVTALGDFKEGGYVWHDGPPAPSSDGAVPSWAWVAVAAGGAWLLLREGGTDAE